MDAIDTAAQQNDLEEVMATLKQALDLNCRVMEPLVVKFHELLAQDIADLQEILRQNPPRSYTLQAKVGS